MKRKHQRDFETVIDSIVDTSCSVRKILVKVTPGGGKSALPLIAGRLIGAGLVDKLLWICPRMALQVQGERNFIDPFFRTMFNHTRSIRQSTNEPDPCRGLDGFITTYQAISVDVAKTVLQELQKRRYLVILDEFHHVELDGEWHRALASIMKLAEYQVLMTGTLERGDDHKIAFLDYEVTRYGHRPFMTGNSEVAVINYERIDALEDHAILPLHFVFSDGRSSWENAQGREIHTDSFYNVLPKERGPALYAALSTEFAEHLLALSMTHYTRYLKAVRTAKLLVVTANIGEARRHFMTLAENGYGVGLATSHDTQEAVDRIEDFRAGRVNILVTIAMAYEGLDIPEISHIACLTHIRSKPWIEQMFARAVRINKHAGDCLDQVAYVFSPDDILMREIVIDIEREQLRSAQAHGAKKLILSSSEKEGRPGIVPLGSAATNQREATLNATPKTPKQKEELILREIEGHIRSFSFANRLDPWTVNTELVREFGKKRRSMRMPELLKLLRHIEKVYPLGKPIRGTGITRVPKRAQFVQQDLFDAKFMKGFEY